MAAFKTIVETTVPSTLTMKPENTPNLAKCTVNYAPTHATLSSWTWVRALKIDPKHGRLQRQAQVCFYGCTFSMCVQTPLIILMLFCVEGDYKECDVYSGALSRIQASI